MSQIKTDMEITQHKNSVISNLSSFMDELISSDNYAESKKADLISYWLKDFQTYLAQENTFDPAKIKSYKRGDVVKVNLGFNVGSEQGGLRYAIILDKNNRHNAKTITVIPLTSQKEEKQIYERDVFLGKELYNRIKAKHDSLEEDLKLKNDTYTNEVVQNQKLFNLLIDRFPDDKYSADTEMAKLKRNLSEIIEKQKTVLEELRSDSKLLDKINVELHRMKNGSIAKIEQITTISKQRIYDPKKNTDVLSGIRFSDTAMDKINEKIKELS